MLKQALIIAALAAGVIYGATWIVATAQPEAGNFHDTAMVNESPATDGTSATAISAGNPAAVEEDHETAADLMAPVPSSRSLPHVSRWGFAATITGLVLLSLLMLRMHLDIRRA